MATWTKSAIREKIRTIIGRDSIDEYSNSDLDTRINRYYQLVLPADLKLQKNHVFYEFFTTPNQAWYSFDDDTYTNIEPPCFINQHLLEYYQDPFLFRYASEPTINASTELRPWTGDGTTSVFSTTINYKITPKSFVATDNLETFIDTTETYTTSDVTITGSLGGSATINYSTGAISVSFATAPVSGQTIYVTLIQFVPSRPQSVLFYENRFTFSPTPDTVYRFKCKAFKVPDELSTADSRPALDEWGPLIAYGVSREIHADNGEMDAYAEVTALYREQLDYSMRRTNEQISQMTVKPNF